MNDEHFTLVFKGNLSSFVGNPLKTKTPFGFPVVVGTGNAIAIMDILLLAVQQAVETYDDDDFIDLLMH